MWLYHTPEDHDLFVLGLILHVPEAVQMVFEQNGFFVTLQGYFVLSLVKIGRVVSEVENVKTRTPTTDHGQILIRIAQMNE